MFLLTFPIVIPKETLRFANAFTSFYPQMRPSVVKRYKLSQYAVQEFLQEYKFKVLPPEYVVGNTWLPIVSVDINGVVHRIFCHNIKHKETFWKIHDKDDWQENDHIALTTINTYETKTVIEISAVMQWGHLADLPRFLDREFIRDLHPERLFDIIRFSPLSNQ